VQRRKNYLNSISAIIPDTNTLKAINTGDCTSDAPLKTQAFVRKTIVAETATLAVQAIANPPCFDTVIASHLQRRKPDAKTSAVSLTG
jgi:hypothetical protein